MSFKEIPTKSLMFNPFSMIEDDWFLITAEYDGKTSTMTAASGALGHMFRKNVAYINIRPTRYTKSFVDQAGEFSLSFFKNTPENKKILGYLGNTSGRDENKIERCGLTLNKHDGIPYFEEAHTVFLCRNLYCSPYKETDFVNKQTESDYYPLKDYHDMYIADIFRTLVPA
ncbi:MAG: flavin reductase family protein [Clostridia bacterium]|nr:flavin reductase [Lachnospiraceae bacterium]NCC00404.1 flavin reductase family protein [Clostridia bacterium]NCD02603.1 flavin reductase family protein [Clostridia bacterium]